MKPALILHIGAHKTGTTAIQGFLQHSKDALAAAGWDLVDIDGVVNLGNTISFSRAPDGRAQFRFRPGMLDRILAALAAPGRNKIISAEDLFFLNTGEDLARLGAEITALGLQVKIVVYLRNQVDMAISNKAQGAKTTQSAFVFGNDTSRVLPELDAGTREYLSYHQKLELWKTHFPEAGFILRTYDRRQLAKGDSVADFVRSCGLPLKPDRIRLNETTGSKLTNLLHGLRFHGLRHDIASALFRQDCFTDGGGIKQAPSARQAAAFMAAFRKENARLLRDYGIDLSTDCSRFPKKEVLQPDDPAFIFRNIASVLNRTCQPAQPVQPPAPPALGQQAVATIRKSAIALEKTDLKQAHALMQVAHRLRPQGKMIQKKLKEYEEALGL